MKKIHNIPPALKSVDVQRVLRTRGMYMKQTLNHELKEASKVIIKQARKQKKTKSEISQEIENRRSAHFTNEEIQKYWEKQIHIVDTVETHFELKVAQFVKRVSVEYLKHFNEEVKSEKSLAKFKKKDYFSDNQGDLLTEASLSFEPLLQSVAVLAGNHANKLIGLNDPYLPFNYRDKIFENVRKFTKSMLDTDKQVLTDIIDEGIKDGKNINDIKTSIETVFDEYSKTQASRIARTEVLRTSNQAAKDAWEQSGVVEGKEWAAFGADDECQNYDGQIVTLSDSFYGSDSEFQDGDPPLHPNCRCILIPIVTKGVIDDV